MHTPTSVQYNEMASTAVDSFSLTDEWNKNLEHLIIKSEVLEINNEKIGSGCYSEAVLVKLAGAPCVGKRIHVSVFATEEFRKQFSEGCLQLSNLRHPNILQLLGVNLSKTAAPPMLFFEKLPLNLDQCLQKYPQFPVHAKLSVLCEVALALDFLHEQTSPVIHGHLCATNVLLTSALHVKVSDIVRFGVGATIDTTSPYQPPEETQSTSGDIFNFGDIILHVLLQRRPSPLEYKHHPKGDSPNEIATLTEVQRRERYFNEVEDKHGLADIATRCLQDDPPTRLVANKLRKETQQIFATQPPLEYENTLDLLIGLGELTLAKETISTLTQTVTAKENEMEGVRDQIEPLKLEIEAKEQALIAQKQEVDAYKLALQSKEGRLRAHETGLRAKDALIKAKDRELTAKKQNLLAKENLLKSAANRIEVLEQQLSALKRKGESTASPTAHKFDLKAMKLGFTPPVAPKARAADDTSDVVLRKNRGRLGMGTVASDGHAYQNYPLLRSKSFGQSEEVDPKLAKILARRHQQISESESLESIDESKRSEQMSEEATGSDTPKSRRESSPAVTEEDPKLMKILEKRKSFLEDDADQA